MGDRSEESNNGMATSMDQVDSQGKDGGAFGGFFAGGGVLKKGPWTSAEDSILVEYVKNHGEGNWNAVQKHSGLSRCGKSCRLRWANHLRPNLKKGAFAAEEEQKIIELHAKMGNKWAKMASFVSVIPHPLSSAAAGDAFFSAVSRILRGHSTVDEHFYPGKFNKLILPLEINKPARIFLALDLVVSCEDWLECSDHH